jgi:geranylgeranyl diphosphate synthase type II
MEHTRFTPTTTLAPAMSKVMIDDFLKPLLLQRQQDARNINVHYETLWQDIYALYSAGGKRLRSYMTVLAYESYSQGPTEAIIPAAAAQELLHLAMLIHDDIIDRDDVRYGTSNISGQYLAHYEEIIDNKDDRRHYANSAAILAGDLLISEAFILTSEAAVSPQAVIAAQRLLATAIFQVIGGELLDTEASFRGTDAADPLTIAEQKTSSYSFVSPFLMGATLADAPKEQLDKLRSLGEQLGIGFQLRDDIIGIFGDQQQTGKSTNGDILEGKRTHLITEFYKIANDSDREAFDGLFGRHDLIDDEVERVRTLLVSSGAKASIETLITAYQDHAYVMVDGLAIDDDHKQAFRALIDLCLKRDY